MDFGVLLNAYRSIWNNRLLRNNDLSDEYILKDAIKRELLDENSHPRIRKSKEEKMYLALKRIVESNVMAEDQFHLIKLHITNFIRVKR